MSKKNSLATDKENWALKTKSLTRCRYVRSLCSLKLKLQCHPIKSSNLKKTSQSKLPRSILHCNHYNLKQKPKFLQHLGKPTFLSTILSIGVTVITTVYILDDLTQLPFEY